MDESSSSNDWPRRWHQVVAEYNASFESHQNRMRAYFENCFDSIRRENDDKLCRIREERDNCAERFCDLLDKQEETDALHTGLKAEVFALEQQMESLDSQLVEPEKLTDALREKLVEEERTSGRAKALLDEELISLDRRKRDLRDEIRDLNGFVRMNKQLSLAGGESSSILATVRGARRR